MNYKIAIICPQLASDVLADTIFDGLLELSKEGHQIDFVIPKEQMYSSPIDLKKNVVPETDFITYAKTADIILLMQSKRGTNYALAEKIGRWNRTVFIDGSEVGKNRRYDSEVQRQVLKGIFDGGGNVNKEMLSKCMLYFKREKPYIDGILALPFGIETRYRQHYFSSVQKDIDFFCVFGQEDYPPMRKHAKELVKEFCIKNNFTYRTEPTTQFSFDQAKTSGREEFYKLLARSKVGISIGGGGYDTGRFWEILGNNCVLIAERIDIFPTESDTLSYKRISQFNNLYDLDYFLRSIGQRIKKAALLTDEKEYTAILEKHSSKARVMYMLEEIAQKIMSH